MAAHFSVPLRKMNAFCRRSGRPVAAGREADCPSAASPCGGRIARELARPLGVGGGPRRRVLILLATGAGPAAGGGARQDGVAAVALPRAGVRGGLAPAPYHPRALQRPSCARLSDRIVTVVGAGWNATVSPAPPRIAADVLPRHRDPPAGPARAAGPGRGQDPAVGRPRRAGRHRAGRRPGFRRAHADVEHARLAARLADGRALRHGVRHDPGGLRPLGAHGGHRQEKGRPVERLARQGEPACPCAIPTLPCCTRRCFRPILRYSDRQNKFKKAVAALWSYCRGHGDYARGGALRRLHRDAGGNDQAARPGRTAGSA